MAKVQLNFKVSKGTARNVRADARRNGITIDSLGEMIIGDFFNGWTAKERAEFYRQLKPKTTGRRISNGVAPIEAPIEAACATV